MIPENIQKLLLSSDEGDVRIAFLLAKKQGLETNDDFRSLVYYHVKDVDKYVDRTFATLDTNLYYDKFEILD